MKVQVSLIFRKKDQNRVSKNRIRSVVSAIHLHLHHYVIEDLLLTLTLKVSSQYLPLITIFRSLPLSVLSVLTLITIVSSARSDKEYNVV